MNIYNDLIERIEPILSAVPLLMVIFAFIGLSLNPNLKGKKRIIIRVWQYVRSLHLCFTQ